MDIKELFADAKKEDPKKEEEEEEEPKSKPMSKLALIIGSIFFIAFGSYAAYLSWGCNTASNTSVGLKVFFAFFAFLGNFGYIIQYWIMRSKDCKILRYVKATNNDLINQAIYTPPPVAKPVAPAVVPPSPPAPTPAPVADVAPKQVAGRRRRK